MSPDLQRRAPHGRLREVAVQALGAERLAPLIGPERMARHAAVAVHAREALAGRVVFNVNSTAAGGGVAEMLQTLLAYVRGVGVDARWLVIGGDPRFFAITKRIHNGLYGSPGDGGTLGEAERRHYEAVLRGNAEELHALVRPGDVVLLHDPQPAALATAAKRAGATVYWRCHIGQDTPNAWSERAWAFLAPYLGEVDAFVVSRAAFAPPWADPSRVHVIPPSIDPFSTKNAPMRDDDVRHALAYIGLVDGRDGGARVPFVRRDGSPGRIGRKVDIVQTGPPPPPDAPLVAQISRWDRMKDMAGVMEGFAAHVDHALGAHPRARRTGGDRRRGRPGGGRGAARLPRSLARAAPRRPRAHPSRVHADARPRRAGRDDQRAATACDGRRAEEPRRGLRAHRRRGDVEAAPDRRQRGRRHPRPDRRRRARPPARRSDRSRGVRRAVERLVRDPGTAARLAGNARARARDEFLGDRHLEQYAALLAPRAPSHDDGMARPGGTASAATAHGTGGNGRY